MEVVRRNFQYQPGKKISFPFIKQFFIDNDIKDNIISYLNIVFNTQNIFRSNNRKYIINLSSNSIESNGEQSSFINLGDDSHNISNNIENDIINNKLDENIDEINENEEWNSDDSDFEISPLFVLNFY